MLVHGESTASDSRLSVLIRTSRGSASVGLTHRFAWYIRLGLPLLYSSTFFVAALTPSGAYFLPARDLFRLIILPSALVVGFGSLLGYLGPLAHKWVGQRLAQAGAVLILAALLLIGLKGIMNAAGYDWQDRLPPGANAVTALRNFKIVAFLAALTLVWVLRGKLAVLARILGSLGFAFATLAAIRLVLLLWNQHSETILAGAAAAAYESPGAYASAPTEAAWAGVAGRSRRVVWVIFDETDFNRAFKMDRPANLVLTHFNDLAQVAVVATNANAPAGATLYSIPALLTGTALAGDGVHFDKSGEMWLEGAAGQALPFVQANSVIGTLTASGRDVSVLGFYHPYCKVFKLSRCDGFPVQRIGRLDDAVWANVPDFLTGYLRGGDYWDSITRNSLKLLPQYVARDDALTFVHLNFPHPPGRYADQALNLPVSGDPLLEYAHNLKFTDEILGEIIRGLEAQSSRHDLLLVVSTDHWLRNIWYRAKVADTSQPIPLIVWHVGETRPFVLSQPLSTVHTAAMVLRFLDGELGTQAEIAKWWAAQVVEPTFIPPAS